MNRNSKEIEDDLVGTKVKIRLSTARTIERVLNSDKDGLYVLYKNKRVDVTPQTNCLDKNIRGYYKGLDPKDAKRINSKKQLHERE